MSTRLAVLGLVLGLVFCGAANAATLELKIEIVDYTTGTAIDPATLTAGMDFGIKISALSTGTGNDPGGVASAAWWISTPDTVNVAVPLAAGSGPNANKVGATWGSALSGGFNFSALAAKTDIGGDGDVDASNQAFGIPTYTVETIGVGGYTVLATQKWHMNTTAVATLHLVVDAASRYLDYTNYTAADFTRGYDSVVGMDLVIGPAASNTPPGAPVVNPTEIVEASWTKEAGWNNLAHSVNVTAASLDADNDPLTYEWKVTKPGGASKILGTTGGALHLTLADIADMGLPAYAGADDPSYHWTISVRANDGTEFGAATEIATFVPEPATMGLLAFGVFGLLKRRRA